MDLVSIVFIAVIILFIIIGIIKGFAASVIDFLGQIIILIVAYLLTNVLTPIVANISIFTSFKSSIYNALLDFNPLFGELFYKDNPEAINQAVQSLKIPSIISPFISNEIIKIIPDEGIIIGEAISSLLIQIICSIICFALIYLILRLSLVLIKKLFKSIISNIKPIKKIDRLLGAVLGLFIGIISVNIICLILTLTMSIPLLEEFNLFVINQMQLNSDTWTLSKYMYQNNLLLLIITWII